MQGQSVRCEERSKLTLKLRTMKDLESLARCQRSARGRRRSSADVETRLSAVVVRQTHGRDLDPSDGPSRKT